MLCTFPVKSPPGCKISLYLHPSIYAINTDIGAEWLLLPFGKKLWECCIWKQWLAFFFLSQIKELFAFVFYSDLVKLCLYTKVKVRIETNYAHNELPGWMWKFLWKFCNASCLNVNSGSAQVTHTLVFFSRLSPSESIPMSVFALSSDAREEGGTPWRLEWECWCAYLR